MLSWIISKIRWLFLIAAVGGPFVAYGAWEESRQIKSIQDNGVAGVAIVNGATIEKRRSVKSYKLDISWKDAGGTQHTAKGLSVSSNFAEKIIVDKKIRVGTVAIKYLAGRPEISPIILADADYKIADAAFAVPAALVGGSVGIIGSLAFFMFARRRRSGVQPKM